MGARRVMPVLAAAAVALICSCAQAFYLPGVIPTTYYPGDDVEVKVNSVTSVETHIPFEYYKYPVCEPEKIQSAAENLGELLTGSRIYNSPYVIKMGQSETCKVLCKTDMDIAEAHILLHSIRAQYSFNWIIDNLPVAASVNSQGSEYVFYEHGYFIGGYFVKENTDLEHQKKTADSSIVSYFVNNHVHIIIKTHQPIAGDAGRRIVGVEVVPASIKHNVEGELPEYLPAEACEFDDEQMGAEPMTIPSFFFDAKSKEIEDPNHIAEIIYTYDVEFQDSDVKWASRWDVYLSMGGRVDNDVHWFSIVNSVMIVFLLSGMVAIILLRTLRRDVLYYNRIPTEEEREEEKEESGWKLIHAHVFRPPEHYPMVLSVLVGSGAQLFLMAVALLIFSAVGFLSPANRGSLMIACVAFFVMLSSVGGYAAAVTYKMFDGEHWHRCTVATALSFPGLSFTIFFIVNTALWAMHSAGAVPFGSMFAIVAMWLGISLPLTFVGAYLGYQRDKIEPTTAVVGAPAEIPPSQWYLSSYVTVLVGGVLPFGVVFVELFFILSSLWLDQFYYVFGFLFLVFLMLTLVCAELTIVLTYFQLCNENYKFWWRSFFTGGSCALYIWLYCLYYFFTKLEVITFVSGLTYFLYMYLVCVAIFIMCGFVGFICTAQFVHSIYGSLRVD
eukprot:INCI3477.1.p1 GENE.INCI3477.1~~INCI3477.1.p1  ORF type:complete len:669 (+),score=115.62 INCI3477.1:147-2153(+)